MSTNGVPPEHDPGEDLGPRSEQLPVEDLVDHLPGLARIAASAWLRTAFWSLETSIRLGARVARAAASPEEAVRLWEDVGSGLRSYARELLGISDLDDRVRQLMPAGGSIARARRAAARGEPRPALPSLREQGAELLRQSADVSRDDGTHPAYERILSELAPDEGRILRLLAKDGPQPIVDVHSANLIGVGMQLVERGLNMVGAEAGARHVDRVPAYLSNLRRLGLIWFSREPLDDPQRYQVLEAQPEAIEALKRAGRAKTVHRSVELTPLGKDFTDEALPLEEESHLG
jgi:hypothetical protein